MIKRQKRKDNLAAGIIGTVVLMLIMFGIVVSMVGFIGFTNTFKKEYSDSTYHIADTAASLVNGDHIDAYLAGKEKEEYRRTKKILDSYCTRMNVSLIYVIKVDTSDYGSFVSVFNSVENRVDDSNYTEWELGYERDTTNYDYARKYKDLYENRSVYETVYRINTGSQAHPHITTMIPIRNSQGNVTALLCVQRPIHEILLTVLPYFVMIIIATFLSAYISARGISTFIEKFFVEPIRKVSDEATRFAKENTRGEPLGDISRYREIANLAYSIDTMEKDMVNYIDNLTAITAERERIGAELSLASEIQEGTIPNVFPAFPERTEFDIYASMTPAKEVGGDFYNFFLIDDNHLGIVIGDVSGKGIPAALFMMVTNIVLTERSHMKGTPAEILEFANTHICEHNKMDMFVTTWLGILELDTGKLISANAGHEDAAVCRKEGTFEIQKTRHGIPVGAISGVHYDNYERQLNTGDKLFIYTDGVPEAADGLDKMFGLGRMLETLNCHRKESPQKIIESIHTAVNDFVGDAPQFDDLTVLCLEYKGNNKN